MTPSPLRERPRIPHIDAASSYIITRIPTTLIDAYCSANVLLHSLHYYYSEEAGMLYDAPIEQISYPTLKFMASHAFISTHWAYHGRKPWVKRR